MYLEVGVRIHTPYPDNVAGTRRPAPARRFLVCAVALVLLAIAACGGDPTPTAVPPPSPTATPLPATPTPVPTPKPAPESQTQASSPAAVGTGAVTVALEDGTTARYLVREQLARRNLPNDAVGVTSDVSGSIVFDDDGGILSEHSKITVDLSSLRSDEGRRDRFVRNNTLETGRFPEAEFVATDAPGLEWPLPSGEQVSFELAGEMTMHGVTMPLTWEVEAEFGEAEVTGVARTSFTFDTFDMQVPTVFVVLSVEDNIRLELDFQASIVGSG